MSAVNGCILLILIIGHTELWVAWVNRTHGMRIPGAALHRLRHVHDLAVVGFPLALVIFVGLTGPKVLLGGSWSALGTGWSTYLALCVPGFVGFVWGVVRWQLFRHPARCRTAIRSTVVDYSTLPGGPPVGQGPHAEMVKWPRNEQLQLEISEKHFEIDMPAEWADAKPLSILHLSDWHFIGTPDLAYYEQLVEDASQLNCDLIVFTGDLNDDNELIKWIKPTLGKLTARLGCFYILGNHDWPMDIAATRAELDSAGWQGVAGTTKSIDADGRSIVVGGSELPWMGPAPDFSSAPAEQLRILLSHSPDNFRWAQDRAIHIMLSGHNHGGQVILPIIGPVYSPSRTGVKYSHGDFYQEPTLLHVSRGISGRHPLRINCRPEITKLVFRPTL